MMWCAKKAGVPVRILHSHSSKLGETRKKELRNRAFCPILRSLATDYLACSKIAGQMMFGKIESLQCFLMSFGLRSIDLILPLVKMYVGK